MIFMTPAEIRGAGGFIGNFAELTATEGDVELTRSRAHPRAHRGSTAQHPQPERPTDYLVRYGRFNIPDYQQDATLSPDFPSVAQVMAELYPQSGGQPVDGVIGLDPTGLATLLEFTGPVVVEGLPQPLTAENAVEVLTKSQYIDVPDDAERGEILTEAVRVTFDKLTSATLPTPRKLSETLSPAARAGHLRVWSPDDRVQETFERLGTDGTLGLPTGADGFSLIQQNVGNNKLDAYLERTMDYRATVDAETGELTGTLRVELTNAVPARPARRRGRQQPSGADRHQPGVVHPVHAPPADGRHHRWRGAVPGAHERGRAQRYTPPSWRSARARPWSSSSRCRAAWT